ncbi:retrotransposon protein, putative, ty3-gypsy subclass, partial [Tanacetum coccineum]
MAPRRNRVNNEADPAFTTAVAQAVEELLLTLTARITDKIRQNENNGNNGNRRNARHVNIGGSGNDGDAQPTDIHIAHIEKIFEVLGCGDQFKARLATYKLEGDAHSWWRAYKQAKGGDAYVATLSWNDFRDIFFLQYFPYSEKEKCEREYKSIRQLPEETSIDFMKRFLRLAAQVANSARNIEIFRDRSKNEGNNKRDRDGHRIRPSETPSQGSNQRAYDRRDSDRYGNGGRYGNRDRYGSNRGRSDRQGNSSDRRGIGTQRAWRDQDQQVRCQQYGRSYGSSSQSGYLDFASSPPCKIYGKLHPGKACHRATGACFECGEVGHLAKDCKKGSTSSRGNRNNKPHATNGRVFALTTDQAANAPERINLAEYMISSGCRQSSTHVGQSLMILGKSNGIIHAKIGVTEVILESKIQADCDMKATNIILQGLPADIYSLVNHHRVAKDLWERVQLLMQGTSLTKQERECKLYDAFDKFTHIKGESLHTYYLRFTQLINDMNIYKMKMEQFQVNTKFLNSLPPEWSKFVTDVKLVKDLHTSNFDQLHAYLEQHELHANEVRIMRERNQDPLAFVANQQMTPPHFNTYQFLLHNPQFKNGFVVPVFSPKDDPIACLNKAMAFLTVIASLRFPSTNNQLRTSSNPRTQATIQDGQVPNSETYLNDMDNQSMHALRDFEQTPAMDFNINEISMDVPSELPKVSLVNVSLKNLKFHLTQFDSVVKKRTTPNALEEGEWGFKHTKNVFNNEIIPFLKSLKDIFNVFDKDLLNEITEAQTIFGQMETVVQQFSVDKQCLEIAKKEILLENDRLLQKIMSHDVLLTMMSSMSLNNDSVKYGNEKVFKDQFDSIKQTRIRHKEQSDSLINKLNLKSVENEDIKNDLRKSKGKEIVENVVYIPSATTIAPGMFKLDLEPLPPRLRAGFGQEPPTSSIYNLRAEQGLGKQEGSVLVLLSLLSVL